MSAFGDLKYPADFKHFDYVNLECAEGRAVFDHSARVRAFNQSFLTFNSLNAYILKGEGAQGMELTFATLMARAGDEPDAMYGLAARSRADFAGRADLSLPAAARSAIPRWLASSPRMMRRSRSTS